MKQPFKLITAAFAILYICGCTAEDPICSPGLSGTDCKTEARAKYLGSFTGHQACTTGTDSVAVGIAAFTGDYSRVNITGLYQQGFTTVGTVLTDGSIKIALQDFGTGKINGSANVENGKIRITYGVNDGLGSPSDSCQWLQY